MKIALLVLAVLGGVWGARSLSGDTGPWGGADRHTTFFDDGSPRSSATLEDGRFEGPARTWYAHGRLESEGQYADGERVGAWRFWSADGALDAQRSGRYESGRRVGPLPE